MRPALSGVPGRDLVAGVAIGVDRRPRAIDHTREVGHIPDRRPRVEAQKEADLGSIDVAQPGHHGLIEQRFTDRARWIRTQTTLRFVGIPVGAEQIGAEVANDALLLRPFQYVHDRKAESDGNVSIGLENDARLVAGMSPAIPRLVDVPRSIHLEVSVERDLVPDPEQKVFPARHDLIDATPREIERRVPGHAEVAPPQNAASQRPGEARRGQEDGVALRHGASSRATKV